MENDQPPGFSVSPFGKSFIFIIREAYDLRSLQIPRISATMIDYLSSILCNTCIIKAKLRFGDWCIS